jgi:multiple antibiotic resistance protein
VTLGANFPSTPQPFAYDALSAVAGSLIVCVLTYFCFTFAERLQRTLGATGLAVVMRLSAFILLCIGVQIDCGTGSTRRRISRRAGEGEDDAFML